MAQLVRHKGRGWSKQILCHVAKWNNDHCLPAFGAFNFTVKHLAYLQNCCHQFVKVLLGAPLCSSPLAGGELWSLFRPAKRWGILSPSELFGCLFLVSKLLCWTIATSLKQELLCFRFSAVTAELDVENTATRLGWDRKFLLGHLCDCSLSFRDCLPHKLLWV